MLHRIRCSMIQTGGPWHYLVLILSADDQLKNVPIQVSILFKFILGWRPQLDFQLCFLKDERTYIQSINYDFTFDYSIENQFAKLHVLFHIIWHIWSGPHNTKISEITLALFAIFLYTHTKKVHHQLNSPYLWLSINFKKCHTTKKASNHLNKMTLRKSNDPSLND